MLFGDEEDFGLDPEALPRRLLSDFSVYNAEVRAAIMKKSCCHLSQAAETTCSCAWDLLSS